MIEHKMTGIVLLSLSITGAIFTKKQEKQENYMEKDNWIKNTEDT